MANIVITYFLWLIGGWFGLHHFYLGRDRHAFIWWTTWGGFFGLGWFRDLWRIPEYIHAANRDHGYLEEYKQRVRYYKTPDFGVVRFAGEIIVGFTFGLIVRSTIPEDFVEESAICWFLATFVPPCAVAIGVHLVANVQPHVASMKWPLIGAYIGLPWLLYDSQNLIYSSLISAVLVNWKGKQWDLEAHRPKRGFCKRISILSACGTIYLILWGGSIYFNASITTRDGESIPLREAIPNFFNSPAWADTKETFKQIYDYYKIHGFSKMYEEIVEKLDPTGEANALKVLELDENATEKEIKSRYKELAKKYHPDRQKDPSKKKEAEDKFVEIQKAYETLSSIKNKRSERNQKSRKGTEYDQDNWRYKS
ncbi:hypothetical protein FSP39_000660 [Pinctada imbricata]|uniref:DnaJ homolog subfamily C member 22 n=1 Tax=Pinctada imbricata TaxID=66713 RepID=A0AA88XCI0_PINIB|nr:hypothetical protein FSP39_000660 [Pinctada imbricata]